MLLKVMSLAALAAVILTPAAALPLLPWGKGPVWAQNIENVLANLVCPLSNGTAELPAPEGLALKALTVGRGTQNYTCGASSTAAPASGGATALLLNTMPFVPFVPPSIQAQVIAQLPAYALAFSRQQLEASHIKKDGVHYFDGTMSPTFDLGAAGLGTFVAKKNGNIGAPKNATQGPNGAVDWLDLGPKDSTATGQISRVYRVDTASGMPPKTCEGQVQSVNIDYAALYYFYGPPS